jgi:hypothetical protein
MDDDSALGNKTATVDLQRSARFRLVPVTYCTNAYTTDLFGVSRQVDTIPVMSPATWTPRLLPRQLGTASAWAGNHDDLVNSQAKCYFQLIFLLLSYILTAIILVSTTFADLLYMLVVAPFSLPLRHTRWLGVAILRVVRPEGLN